MNITDKKWAEWKDFFFNKPVGTCATFWDSFKDVPDPDDAWDIPFTFELVYRHDMPSYAKPYSVAPFVILRDMANDTYYGIDSPILECGFGDFHRQPSMLAAMADLLFSCSWSNQGHAARNTAENAFTAIREPAREYHQAHNGRGTYTLTTDHDREQYGCHRIYAFVRHHNAGGVWYRPYTYQEAIASGIIAPPPVNDK